MSAAGTTAMQALGNMTTATSLNNLATGGELLNRRLVATGFEIVFRSGSTERVRTRVVICSSEVLARQAILDEFKPPEGKESTLQIIAAVPVVVSL